MIAAAVRSGLEVHTVDGVDIGVVFPVALLPIAAVHPYRPQLKHLPHNDDRILSEYILFDYAGNTLLCCHPLYFGHEIFAKFHVCESSLLTVETNGK